MSVTPTVCRFGGVPPPARFQGLARRPPPARGRVGTCKRYPAERRVLPEQPPRELRESAPPIFLERRPRCRSRRHSPDRPIALILPASRGANGSASRP